MAADPNQEKLYLDCTSLGLTDMDNASRCLYMYACSGNYVLLPSQIPLLGKVVFSTSMRLFGYLIIQLKKIDEHVISYKYFPLDQTPHVL